MKDDLAAAMRRATELTRAQDVVQPFVPTLEHVDELRGLPMSLSHVASWPSTDAHRLMRFVRLLEVFKHCRCYFVDLGTPDETAALIERTVQDNAQCA